MSRNLTAKAKSLLRIQQYDVERAIEGVEIVELKRFNDDGGSMVELLRLDGSSSGFDGFELRQVNYSCVQPDVIKAFHLHRQQTDLWFVRPEDRLLLVLVDVREGSPTADRQLRTVLGDGKATLVRIPPGVAHGCRNLGSRPASVIYFTDRHFEREPDRCDEGRLPWDLVGEEVWNVVRE
jgi:dTDP-4-dehydrorhamnose 3,5-epimerase